VNELGEMLLSSVYYGSRPIHHSQLKVSKSNGEYTETQSIPYDGGMNYSFVDGGMTTEVVTYTKGKDDGVIQFIYNNKESALKAELIGKEKYTFTISAADKNVLVKTFDFAIVLSDVNKLQKEIEKSSQRLQYLESKLKSGSDE
jgi:prepilin-type processing-associated H-X9-DG protein